MQFSNEQRIRYGGVGLFSSLLQNKTVITKVYDYFFVKTRP